MEGADRPSPSAMTGLFDTVSDSLVMHGIIPRPRSGARNDPAAPSNELVRRRWLSPNARGYDAEVGRIVVPSEQPTTVTVVQDTRPAAR
jgi:hypothetical protein